MGLDAKDYCEVGSDGVHHLFIGWQYGTVCACGRKRISCDDEGVRLRDVRQPSGLLPIVHARSKGLGNWKLDVRLTIGETQIRCAQRLRATISAARREWSVRRAAGQSRRALRLRVEARAVRERCRAARVVRAAQRAAEARRSELT